MHPVASGAELSAEWFTALFRALGAIDTEAVRHAEVIPFGHGLTASTYRVFLSYDPPCDSAPASVIVKTPAESRETRAVASSLDHYKAEVMAYRKLLPSFNVRVPRCYFAAYDDETNNFALVLEDLCGLTRAGNQLAGGSPEELRLAIGELVKLQAAWWRHDIPPGFPWLFNPARSAGRSELVVKSMVALRPKLMNQLEPEQLQITEKLVEYVTQYFSNWFAGAVLQHGDFRLDNMLFGISSEQPPITIIDWQGLKVGPPTVDICLLLGSSLPREERQRLEREMLRFYYDGLVSQGVSDWTFEECWRSYRLNALFPLYANLIVAGSMDLKSERGQIFALENLRKFADYVIDVRSLDVLKEETT